MAYWAKGEDRRIFIVAGQFLQAIEAATAKAIPSFGQDGRIDLKQDLGCDATRLYLVGTICPARIKELSQAWASRLRK